jgi:hypothetical protein
MYVTANNPSFSTRFDRMRTSAYWTATILVAFENSAGAMWVFLPLIPRFSHTNTALVFAEYLRTMLAHLGYSPYFKYILGPWQLACAAALVTPRLARVKEWAYFGAFLNYSSAFISHQFAGDRPDIASGALAVLTIIAWALRPPDRRLAASTPDGGTSVSSWATSAGILVLLLILSLFWLPPISKT